MSKQLWLAIVLAVMVVAGCGQTPAPTAPTAPVATTVPTLPPAATTLPAGTATPEPRAVPTPVPAPMAVDVDPARYIDNRSDPVAVLQSFYNAINRHEYVRAYSYWQPDAAATFLPPYPDFEQGYSNTLSVALSVGMVTGGAAAGNLYYAVPVVLRATDSGGAVQTFAGCYVLHLGQPANYGAPPFPSMALQWADVQVVADEAAAAGRAAVACQESGYAGSPLPPAPAPPPGDTGTAYYIDDRSGPAEVLQSFYNAINRHEYVRAYSYWKPDAAAAFLPPYPQFEQGYSTTVSVQLTTGEVLSDAGAGQLYYRLPAALVAVQADGTTNTFVGCYTLHLGQPAVQGAPPFRPLGIAAADVQGVANDADIAALLGQACR